MFDLDKTSEHVCFISHLPQKTDLSLKGSNGRASKLPVTQTSTGGHLVRTKLRQITIQYCSPGDHCKAR